MGFLLDMGTLALLTRVLSFPSEGAFLLSAFVGATLVFFFNKHVTFKHHSALWTAQILRHYSVYGPAIVANFFLSTFLYWIGFSDLLAKMVAVAAIAIVNYLLSHHYVFKKHE